jgi:hypothetical protein
MLGFFLWKEVVAIGYIVVCKGAVVAHVLVVSFGAFEDLVPGIL